MWHIVSFGVSIGHRARLVRWKKGRIAAAVAAVAAALAGTSIAGVPATSVAPPAAARRHPVQRELQVGGLLAGDPPDKLLERVRVGLARVDHVPEVEESGEATPSRQRHLDHGMLPGPQPAAGDSEPEGIQGLRRS